MLMGLNQDFNVVSLNSYHKVQITTLSWVSVLPCSKQGGVFSLIFTEHALCYCKLRSGTGWTHGAEAKLGIE